MKKAVVFALTGIMAVSMFGCGSKKQVEVSSVDDLKDLTIGVQTGTTGDSYASDAVASDSQMKRYNKGADAIQALKTGKIDAVVIDSLPAQKFVDANDDLKIVENIWEPEEYAICLKKGNTELTEKMNAAISELKDDGTLDKIMANYIGDDTGSYQYETPEGTEYTNGTLTMATNAEFEPWEYKEGDNIVGIDAEIAQAMADKLGLKLEIVDMDFDSLIASIQSGKIDMSLAGMTVTEERKQNVDFTDSYATGVQVIIVKDDSDIASVDDLQDKLIGVQQGTTGHLYCADDFGEDHVNALPNGATAVQALLQGKVDCVVIDQEPAKAFVEANEGLKILDTAYTTEDYAAAVSKDNPELTAALNKALQELKDDGTIQGILDKYIKAE